MSANKTTDNNKQKPHILVKTDKSAVLGVHKWISRNELLSDASCLVVLSSDSAANGIKRRLENEGKNAQTMPLETLCKAWMLNFNGNTFTEKFPTTGALFGVPLDKSLLNTLSKDALGSHPNQASPKHNVCVTPPYMSTEDTLTSRELHANDFLDEMFPCDVVDDSHIMSNSGIAFTDNPDIVRFIDVLSSIQDGFALLREIDADYYAKFRKIQNQLIDEEHYAEFNQLSAKDGYEVYKRIHDLRLERRKVKDSITAADMMRHLFGVIKEFEVGNIMLWMQSQDKRQYRLREPKMFIHKKKQKSDLKSD